MSMAGNEYTNGGSTIDFWENKYGQLYIEINDSWISIPYDEAIKIGQKITAIGEEIENKNNV